jgi:hypothetical protein
MDTSRVDGVKASLHNGTHQVLQKFAPDAARADDQYFTIPELLKVFFS